MRPLTPARDAVLLIARVLLGVVLVAHGWQKFFGNGITATTAGFEQMGVPAAAASAVAAGTIELVGGLLLILGAFTPVAGIATALVMGGAFWFAHADSGIFVKEGGWELVGVIGLAAMTFAVTGPGRYSVDHALTRRKGARAGSAPDTAPAQYANA